MIAEILTSDRILIQEEGSYESALDSFLQQVDPSLRSGMGDLLSRDQISPYSYLSDGVFIPHSRMEGLHRVELMLVLFRKEIAINGRKIRLLLFLVTPEEESSRHLQLLQGLASLMPVVARKVANPLESVVSRERDEREELLRLLIDSEKNLTPSFLNLTQAQVVFELHTDTVKGLGEDEASRRLEHYGSNMIQRKAPVSLFFKFLRNLFSFFSILLWFAGGLCFLPGVDMPQMGTAIFLVILVNGIFSFVQQYRSDRAVESLQKLITPRCRVVREGVEKEVASSLLVPGDLIVLEEGDIVPADARLIEAYEIEVDNSALTGESTSSRRYKSDAPDLLQGRFLWIELPNILFAGSTLVRGQGRALVFGTGMNSEIGKIAGMTQAIRTEVSPLEKQLKMTIYSIGLLAFSIAFVLLILSWKFAGLGFTQAFLFFIGVFVANVPEGLLPTVTLSLAMAVTRMAKRNALVKNLSSVETLGCTTVICCDKTGTLTQNQQMVEQVFVDGRVVTVSGKGYEPVGEFAVEGQVLAREKISSWPAFRRLLECSVICNNARLEGEGLSSRILGDPTEGALLVLGGKAGVRGGHHRIHMNPFESVRKRMSVVVRAHGGGRKISYMKGAPAETLSTCNQIQEGETVRLLTDQDRKRILDELDLIAARGLRVLGLAYREDDELQSLTSYAIESVEKDHVYLGMTAMTDPIRPEVPEAIAKCHTAGIRVNMITGDYPLTAVSIARQAGIGEGSESLPVVTGSELASMEEGELKTLLKKGECVFARVSPDQKLRIVTVLKELDEIVAVTGDGVNDGPALKKADIGVAMGRRGTDVARESAQVILTDDNFASIVAAVEEGRGVFQNIKRFSAYVFNSNPQELYPYILWMLVPGFPLAMTVMGVLAVDVGTDLIPAMGLGAEPPEKGLMDRPPRRREERVLSIRFILENYFVEGSILAFASFATYYYAGWSMGYMKDGFSFFGVPPSPDGLNMHLATKEYLMSLTAFFFPTVTTQIANVMIKRSDTISLFSREFLTPERRRNFIEAIRNWKPVSHPVLLDLQFRLDGMKPLEAGLAFLRLFWNTLVFPFRLVRLWIGSVLLFLDRPVLSPLLKILADFLEKNYVLVNFISNPLINFGIAFELTLSFLFFNTVLRDVYYFEPVPWHVYLFAFHGTLLLIFFSEVKKYLLRRRSR